MAAPDDTKPYIVDTDASAYGIGAVLSQQHEKRDRPIYFHSRKLSDAEKNYSCTEREALAVISALKKFRVYILGRHTTVRTDHAPLAGLFRRTGLTGRLARWQAILGEYDVTLVTRAGSLHRNADAVSRLVACEDEGETEAVNHDPRKDDVLPAYASAAVKAMYRDDPWYHRFAERADQETGRFRWGETSLVYIDDDGQPRICLREHEVAETVRREHEDSGHFDVEGTLRILKKRYWWPNMVAEVKATVTTCENCQLHGNKPPVRELVQVPTIHPWDLVEVDTVTGLPSTRRHSVGFVTAVDCFTGYCVAQAVPDLTAQTMARFFRDRVIYFAGNPRHVLTDNGVEFEGVFRELLQSAGCKHHLSSPYNPRSHGKVERTQQTILGRLRRDASTDPWDERLPKAVYQTNCRRTRTQQLSPIELLMGYFPSSRRELELAVPALQAPAIAEGDEPFQERLQDLSVQRALFPLKAADSRRHWVKTGPPHVLQIGDRVVVHKALGRPSKLAPSRDKGTVIWWGNKGACLVLVNGVEKRVPQQLVLKFEERPNPDEE